MIEFLEVSKKFPTVDKYALRDLNFKVEEGEFVFLIGPSGSGKTTAMRMIIRDEQPTSGRILFDDRDITRLSRGNIYKLRRLIGVVFQDYKLLAHKNAYENIAFAMEVAGRSSKEIKETVPELLDIVGLGDKEHMFPNQLSGGEQQRVGIARAMANTPRLLIADEPTGNLDPASAWDIVQILTKINSWGTTVIMSTHGTDIVNSLGKRVIQLEGGELVRDDSKGQYELTRDNFSDSVLQAHEPDAEPAKKAVIKVNLKSDKIKQRLQTENQPQPEPAVDKIQVESKVSEEKAETDATIQAAPEVEQEKPAGRKFPFINLLKLGRSPKPEQNTQVMEESVEIEITTDSEEKKIEETQSDKKVGLGLAENKVDKKLAGAVKSDADKLSVDELDIDSGLKELLKKEGYYTIGEVIAAGPDKLLADQLISPIDVIEISQALGEFIEIEIDNKEKESAKSNRNKKHKK